MKEGSCGALILLWPVNVGPKFVPTDAGQPLYFQATLCRWASQAQPFSDRNMGYAHQARQTIGVADRAGGPANRGFNFHGSIVTQSNEN